MKRIVSFVVVISILLGVNSSYVLADSEFDSLRKEIFNSETDFQLYINEEISSGLYLNKNEENTVSPLYLTGDKNFIKIASNQKGGTVTLKRTGTPKPYDFIYTKIEYIPKDIASGMYAAKTKPGFSSWLKSEITGVITGAGSAAIAKHLGISSSKTIFFIGLTASGATYMLSNLDTSLLLKAIQGSKGGAISIEHGYTSQPYRNGKVYRPWKDGVTISAPLKHTYKFAPGVYPK